VSAIAAHDISMLFPTRRGTVKALDNVSVDVPDASFACLVGASGCGKSTLLNIMAGLLPPTSGTVTLDGHQVEGPGADRGMVFQSYTLYPWLRVRENVEFGPALKGTSKKERRKISGALLEEMKLADFARAYPRELSGGMKQRVAIARALALQPQLLLMDEPFGSLDAITRQRLQAELNRIVEQTGVTLMFVTHSIEEALVLGDRIVVLGDAPSTVLEIVDVRDLGSPETAEYGAMRGKLRSLLEVERESEEDEDGSID
jgi:NitT/TauT family transport system ATP-binding protein